MILTLEPTDRIEHVEGAPHRVWTGTSDEGVPVHAWIALVQPQTHDTEANERFARKLREIKGRRELVSFDIRMVL